MADGKINQPSWKSKRIRPTPFLAEDSIVVERVDRTAFENNSELFDTSKLLARYGRPWPADFDALVTKDDERSFFNFPDHVLTFCVEDGNDMLLYYAKDRERQDEYSYGMKLSSESVEHPIYNRLYLVRRQGYQPLPELMADPFKFDALLVSEEMVNEAPEELKSLYVIVRRVYETLPGPILTDYNYDDLGNLVATSKQVVALPFQIAETTVSTMQTLQPISVRKGVVTTTEMKNADGSIPWNPETNTWREILLVADDIPGSYVTIDYYYVAKTDPLPPNTLVITYERRKHPTNPRLAIEIKKEYTIPDTYYEINSQGYRFPSRYVGFEWDPTFTYARWNFIPALSGVFPALIETSFSTTMPSQEDLEPFYFREANWRFPFGFAGTALTDENPIDIYVGGTLVWDGPELPPSVPSAATYPAGDPIVTSGEAKIYRTSIYRITIATIIAL